MTSTENVALRKTAAERAARIRAKASDLIQEIADAFNDKDHLALGYSTWHEYCAHELNGSIAIPSVKGDRVDFVRGLSAAGLSQRAISEATGVARNTVARYINPPVAQIEPPSTYSRVPVEVDRELEAAARAMSSAPDSGPYVAGDSAASRNVQRFDAMKLARRMTKDGSDLVAILSSVGGVKGIREQLEEVASLVELAQEANRGSGIDAGLDRRVGD